MEQRSTGTVERWKRTINTLKNMSKDIQFLLMYRGFSAFMSVRMSVCLSVCLSLSLSLSLSPPPSHSPTRTLARRQQPGVEMPSCYREAEDDAGLRGHCCCDLLTGGRCQVHGRAVEETSGAGLTLQKQVDERPRAGTLRHDQSLVMAGQGDENTLGRNSFEEFIPGLSTISS